MATPIKTVTAMAIATRRPSIGWERSTDMEEHSMPETRL